MSRAPGPAVPPAGATSTVERATHTLRDRILGLDADNVFLGSEDELRAELGVSRPTLRQVARVLEREQLLTVRRGVRGGFFSQRPSGRAVADMAAVYLRSSHTTLHDLVLTHGLLLREAVARAAANPSDLERARLLQWCEDHADDERNADTHRFHELGLEFGQVLTSISNSPTLALFTGVLQSLASAPIDVRVFDGPERIRAARALQLRLARAVRDGNVKAALAAWRRQYNDTLAWTGSTDTAEFGLHS